MKPLPYAGIIRIRFKGSPGRFSFMLPSVMVVHRLQREGEPAYWMGSQPKLP